MIRKKYIAIAAISFFPLLVMADDQGKLIAEKEYNRDVGRNAIAKIKMQLVDKRGHARERLLVTAYRFVEKKRQQYIRFDLPKTIAGTSFLSFEKSDEDDEQFLYLPATGRVRRIVSGQKSRSFVNTDFSYEDLQRRHFEKDNFEIVGKDKFIGRDCIMLRRKPKDPENTQYYLVESCVDQSIDLTIFATFFDKKNKPTKNFIVHDLKPIQGIWTVMKSEMKDLEKQSSTISTVQSIVYNGDLPDEMFTSSYLKSS